MSTNTNLYRKGGSITEPVKLTFCAEKTEPLSELDGLQGYLPPCLMNITPSGKKTPIKRRQVIVIAVEGNICAGKTTSLEKLTARRAEIEELGFTPHILSELIPSTDDLELFYSGDTSKIRRTEMAFQSLKNSQLLSELDSITDDGRHVIFMDRSIYGNYAFTLNNYILGNIDRSDLEFLHTQLTKYERLAVPDVILYLRTPVPICLDRVKKRGKDYEKDISADYLNGLERVHDYLFRTEANMATKSTDFVDGIIALVASYSGKEVESKVKTDPETIVVTRLDY